MAMRIRQIEGHSPTAADTARGRFRCSFFETRSLAPAATLRWPWSLWSGMPETHSVRMP